MTYVTMSSTKYSKVAFDAHEDLPTNFNHTLQATKNSKTNIVLVALCISFAFISAILSGLLYTTGTVGIDKGLATELGILRFLGLLKRGFAGIYANLLLTQTQQNRQLI
jgi:uncharacterized membrane protein required for colicin V production